MQNTKKSANNADGSWFAFVGETLERSKARYVQQKRLFREVAEVNDRESWRPYSERYFPLLTQSRLAYYACAPVSVLLGQTFVAVHLLPKVGWLAYPLAMFLMIAIELIKSQTYPYALRNYLKKRSVALADTLVVGVALSATVISILCAIWGTEAAYEKLVTERQEADLLAQQVESLAVANTQKDSLANVYDQMIASNEGQIQADKADPANYYKGEFMYIVAKEHRKLRAENIRLQAEKLEKTEQFEQQKQRKVENEHHEQLNELHRRVASDVPVIQFVSVLVEGLILFALVFRVIYDHQVKSEVDWILNQDYRKITEQRPYDLYLKDRFYEVCSVAVQPDERPLPASSPPYPEQESVTTAKRTGFDIPSERTSVNSGFVRTAPTVDEVFSSEAEADAYLEKYHNLASVIKIEYFGNGNTFNYILERYVDHPILPIESKAKGTMSKVKAALQAKYRFPEPSRSNRSLTHL